MEKRGLDDKHNISKRFYYVALTLGIMILLSAGVYAWAASGTGHNVDEIDFSAGLNLGAANLATTGSVTAGSFLYSSDEVLKENVQPLEDSLAKLKQLNGVSFDWKANGRSDIGVIAQNVEEVFPELVSTDSEGVKSVEYGNLVAVLIEAVKEQQKQIDELKEKCG